MLEDDLDSAAVASVHLPCAQHGSVFESDCAVERVDADERFGDRRLARARLAHEADDLAGRNGERDVARAGHLRGVPPEQALDERGAAVAYVEILNGEERGWRSGRLGRQQPPARARHRIDQRASVGVAGPGEDLVRRILLDDAAAVDHGDPVGDAGDQREVVRDVERGDARLLLQLGEEPQDLLRGDDVERRRGLVEEDALGVRGEGRGDDDALLLTARCLVRVAAHHRNRVLEPHPVEEPHALGLGRPPLEAAVALDHLPELLAKRQRRVQRGARVLKHHGDPPPAHRRDLARAHGAEVVGPEPDRPARLHGVARQVAHDGVGERGLARARLAHEPQHLAARDGKAHVRERPERSCAGRVVECVAVDREDRRRHDPVLGFSASRRPSPRRLNPTATSAMAIPGQTSIQGLRKRY